MIVDHVTLVTADAARTAADLRSRHGLGAARGGYHDHAGTRTWSVPLEPPSYLELLEVEDERRAAETPVGRRVAALAGAGGGLVAWSVLVDDIHAAAARVGVEVFEGTTRGVYGTVRWWTVTGAEHLPFFIAYDVEPALRLERWREHYERVAHDCAPAGFTRLDVGGDPAEYDAWLGPHDLPLRFVDGEPGLHAVEIETANGPVTL